MKPLEFLAEVLPSPGSGLYCVAELSTRKKQHLFVNDLKEIRPEVKHWVERGYDIYFALATFDHAVIDLPKDRRTAKNARAIRSLFIDMDGYASKKEAVLSLNSFLEKTGLDIFGRPYVIGSGGGVHCYWPLTEDADIVTWKPVAENFKRLCAQEGLRIDMTVTADAARVLRIPGTFNNKKKYPEPRPVQILLEGTGAIDLKHLGATVRGLLTEAYAPASNGFVATAVDIAGTRPSKAATKRSALSEALINNSVTNFAPIWMKTERGVGCKQLDFFRTNAQQDGMEPLWRGLLSWVKVCQDSTEYAQKLTELHPYTPERMHQKLAEIKGPYPCAKMDSENPGVCPGCTYWGTITNGLALGREIQTDNRVKQFEIPLADSDDRVEDGYTDEFDAIPTNVPVRMAERSVPPKGFMYGKDGGVFIELKEKDATGVEVKTQVPVIPYELFVVDLLRTEEKEHHVHLMAIKKIGAPDADDRTVQYSPVIMPTKAVVSRDDLLKCLASHNIYAAGGGMFDAFLYRYVRACVEEAAMLKKAVDVPTQLGWQKDNSFVYNNRIFTPKGEEIAVPMPGLENVNRITNSKGTLENWRKPWELLIQRKDYTMLALCIDSFGAPMMSFSDYEGFCFHIGSTESGAGKSLALSLKAGVWGHPVRYRTGKGTSPVALQQRLGLLNSLPLLCDEVTAKVRNDMEWIPGLIFDVSEGMGKERMESGTNRERVNNTTWATTVTLTSNTHMVDILTGARKHSSRGEMMRLLEWTPNTELKFNNAERDTLKELRRNYGVAGLAWVRWLAVNRKQAIEVWNTVHTRLRDELNFTDEERYWHAACTNVVAASILLGPSYANIITVPVGAITDALHELVAKARTAHQRSARSAEDVLNAYTREFYGKFIVIRKDKDGIEFSELGRDMMGKTSTRQMVMGRIEHGVKHHNYVEYYIEEQLLRQHCATMSFGFADFKAQIEALAKREAGYEVRFGVKKDILSRTDGPSMRVTVMHLTIPKDKLEATVGAIPVVKD